MRSRSRGRGDGRYTHGGSVTPGHPKPDRGPVSPSPAWCLPAPLGPSVTARGVQQVSGRTVRCGAQPCCFQPVEAKLSRFPRGQPLCAAPAARPLPPRPPRCRVARGPFDAAERRAAAGRTMRRGPLFGGARPPLLPRGPQTVVRKAVLTARKLPLPPAPGTPFPTTRRPTSSSQPAQQGPGRRWWRCQTPGEPPPAKRRCFITGGNRLPALTSVPGSRLPAARVTARCGQHSSRTPAATAGGCRRREVFWGESHNNLFHCFQSAWSSR